MTDETTTPVPAGNGAGQSRALAEASGEAPGENGKTTGPTVEVSLTEGPAPDSVAGADPTRCDVLHDAVVRVEAGVGKLLERFDEKLLHDEARTNEIKRLNDELAKHQPDAQWNIARLFVDQMIRHLDEIRRFVQRYKGQGEMRPRRTSWRLSNGCTRTSSWPLRNTTSRLTGPRLARIRSTDGVTP